MLNVTLKPFQQETLDKAKDDRAEIINFSTGAGKTIYAIAKADYLLQNQKISKVIIVCRNHNKTNWQRQFKAIANLDATVAEGKGTAVKRREARRANYREDTVIILNYEKLRLGALGDVVELKKELKGQSTYIVFDEAPVVLKTLSTQVYKGTKSILKSINCYKSILTATPLENNPEDVYALVKLLDETIFTNVTDFRNEYGLTWNPWNPWKVDQWDRGKLREMSQKLDHLIHKADKYKDPLIAAQFPQENWVDVILDMSEEDDKLYQDVLYDQITHQEEDPLTKILILQLICDNPLLLQRSNAKLAKAICSKVQVTDKYSVKLARLKEMIETIDGKIVLFNMYNELGSDFLYSYITKWGFKAVLYDGGPQERQWAEDEFRRNPKIKVFVSSDKGSDSINLEAGSSVINFNLPYKHTTLLQRVNRINRITSSHSNIYYYNLIMANSIDEHKVGIIKKKKDLSDLIFSDLFRTAGRSPRCVVSE